MWHEAWIDVMSSSERNALFTGHHVRPRFRAAMILILLACVFVADTVTDYEIAFAVFYIVVILLAIGFLSTRGVIVLAGVCVGLTVLSLFLTKRGMFEAGLLNCGISVAAIGITTYLVLQTVAAQASAFEAQTQLARVARLTSLGALTASIAHEVNQPLAAIVTSGHACRRWLEREPPNLEKAQQAVDRIIHDANRASDVIVRVRGLARSELPRREALDFNEVIRESLVQAQTQIERNSISMRLQLADGLPPILADRIQVQQVIGNLLLNAMEAMHDMPTFKRELEVVSFVDDAGMATITVTDSGIGIKPVELERLFDAFWTTKEGGMGIGLSISRSIIEAHGGSISVSSKPRMGATFRVSLPVAGANAW
ncbi:two component sensor kinase [Labrys miyagiensis]|uniref:histidine kinase n=2 Tax=Labrys miyagiensis TaxID=346912 RepID=A0ABQ6CLN5_9HYPH|nr:two component sensor kinase [Labrys miyagiensis]